MKWPEKAQKCIRRLFLYAFALAEGQSPPQELEVGLYSVPYLLAEFYNVLSALNNLMEYFLAIFFLLFFRIYFYTFILIATLIGHYIYVFLCRLLLTHFHITLVFVTLFRLT